MASENKKGRNIIVFIVGLVVLGGAVFAGVYLGLSKPHQVEKEVKVEEAYAEMEEILVNLSDEGGKRYAKVTLTLAYNSNNKDLTTEIEEKHAPLRDSAIFYFKSLKADNFTAGNEEALKKELVERLNKNLTEGLIIDVKFNQLLVQ